MAHHRRQIHRSVTWSKFQKIPVPFSALDLFTQRCDEAKAKFFIIDGEKFCPITCLHDTHRFTVNLPVIFHTYLFDI